VFVTEGTDRGVVHLLGMALQACEQRWPVVVGVAPSSKVHDLTETSTNGQIALEPNHSVAVIVPVRSGRTRHRCSSARSTPSGTRSR
jgi:hypothetical protein